jgi:hypothetical protein
VKQAQEDLRQQMSATRGVADQSDTAVLLEQIDSLRQQRDQARSIAQCIARQTSTLADEIYRLRTNGLSSGVGALASATSEEEAHPAAEIPSRMLHDGRPRPELAGALHPEEPEQQRSPEDPEEQRSDTFMGDLQRSPEDPEEQRSDTFMGNLLGGLGAAWAGFVESQAVPNQEGVESQVPRQPVEVTSGWDVFDPDEQTEHTIPTSSAVPASGWGDDMGDLLDGLADPFDAAAAESPPGHPPELSPSPPAATSGAADSGDVEDSFWSDLM